MKNELIRLLQNAHAGERAAAFAYNGHWRSVSGSDIIEIKKIEDEEWEHRECLLAMLKELGTEPRPWREFGMILIGCLIFSLCRWGSWLNVANFGWYFSMYGAGRLEQGNIIEYEVAAEYAEKAGYPHFVKPLLHMSKVEYEHEQYFRKKCLSSKWAQYIPLWQEPKARIYSDVRYPTL